MVKANSYHVATKYLEAIQRRLIGVVIENKSYEGLIPVYDRADVLFYLDPPYYGTEKYYSAKFTIDDHIRLREILGQIEGKFILSYNDCKFVRELYQGFIIEGIERNNSLSARYEDSDKRYAEVVIMNYKACQNQVSLF